MTQLAGNPRDVARAFGLKPPLLILLRGPLAPMAAG
jgi:hypothetical protein